MIRKVALSSLSLVMVSTASAFEITGSAGAELRYYLQDALYTEQERTYGSLFLSPEIYSEFNEGQDTLIFKPFYRFDEHDKERSHGDIRELQWAHYQDNWETKIGVGKVFWGQTESIHLVDIINQTDSVESVDGEAKLGQPMLNFSYFSNYGNFSAFVMPYFRERTFQSVEGRLRPPLAISDAIYESSSEQSNLDYALRWQSSIGDWEVGLSYFSGTTREPELITSISQDGNVSINPYYAQINQLGIDLLKVSGAWLLKLESIYREGQSEDFTALVTGFEYTQEGILGSRYGIGYLLEYQYDERDNNFFAIGQNDIMLGMRIMANDIAGTETLFGFIQDLDNESTYSAYIEASSRLSANWRWKLDGYFFSSNDEEDPFFFLRRDDHIQFSLEYYF